MFSPDDILYEDNHLLIVNKHCGDLVQPDPSGESALEDQIKAFIKRRDAKPGEVFLGVVHRIDRPVSGAVLFAKTSKALTRLNEMLREGRIRKVYWALTEATPDPEQGELRHYILRDGKTNRSRAYDAPKGDAKEARLRYETLGVGTHYTLLGIELLTGRHHQIRAQLSKIGCPIRGDLKYGAKRSLPGGGISLHSRCVEFDHPVRHEPVSVTAPVPAGDNLWAYFENRWCHETVDSASSRGLRHDRRRVLFPDRGGVACLRRGWHGRYRRGSGISGRQTGAPAHLRR